ncbi:MAG: cyclic pyranopterin monophosphate synthase, partial [Miltoncostaeaceae bacterium]
LYDGRLPKGDAAAVARVAGIAGAKRTPDLVALCHPLPLDSVEVDVSVAPSDGEVRVRCEALASARTGVEMQALTGASVGALNVYDMLKAIDPAVTIEVRLLEKTKDEPPE